MWPEFPSVAFFPCQANLIKLGAELENKQTRHLSLQLHLPLLLLSPFLRIHFLHRSPQTVFFYASILHFCDRLPSSASYSAVSRICPRFLSNYGLPQQNRAEQSRSSQAVHSSTREPPLLPDVQSILIMASSPASCLFRSACWSPAPPHTCIQPIDARKLASVWHAWSMISAQQISVIYLSPQPFT